MTGLLHPKVPLGSVATVKSGFAFKSRDWTASGVPVIKIKNVRNGRVDLEGCGYVSEETASNAQAFRLHEGDILVTMSGEIGSVGLVRERGPLLLNQRVGRFTVQDRESLHQPFLYYVLCHPQSKKEMEAVAYGAAQANISPALIESLSIPLPEPSIQTKIAACLSTYDELIENNLRRIEILEEMAQATYREWFVKFRFPGSQKASQGWGRLPQGWTEKAIGEVSTLVSRGVAPKYDEEAAGLVINQRCIRDGRLSLEVARRHRSKVPDHKYVQAGDVLINSTGVGTLGRVAQVIYALDNVTVDTHVTIVRSEINEVTASYFGLTMLNAQSELESMGAGTTGQTELSRARISEKSIIVPPMELQQRFDSIVASLNRLALLLQSQNRNLGETRDCLLPKLISGEIDVSELDIDASFLAA